MNNSGWVDETLSLRVLHRVQTGMRVGMRVNRATEPERREASGRRIVRRSAASAGAFATALTAVLGGSVGMAAAAPAPHAAKAPKSAPSHAASGSSSNTGSKAVKSATTATRAASPAGATKGSLCDSSGSGEAELSGASPTPSYNEGVAAANVDSTILDASTSHTLSFTYFDEAGFVATVYNPTTKSGVTITGAPTASNKALGTVSAGVGSITGPFGSAPGASQYDVGAPLVGHFTVNPATSTGTKSGVPVSGSIPPLTTALGNANPAPGYYAFSITLADDDDSTPAPCSMQWLEHVGAPPPPAPPPPPVVPPAITPPPPTVQITKLNNAAGTGYGTSETAAPGSTSVPYRVTVTNPNASPGTLVALTDTIDGVTTDICPALVAAKTVLAPLGQAGDSVTCNFTGPVPSTPTVDTAGTTLSVNGVLVSATAQSTVFPPVLGIKVAPSTPAPSTPAPATLAFTGAPVGKLLAAALGMLALGLALLAGLQLTEGERRPRLRFAPTFAGARMPSDRSSQGRRSAGSDSGSWFSGAPGRVGPPPLARAWLIGYLQGGWTRLRGPDRGLRRPSPASPPPSRGTPRP